MKQNNEKKKTGKKKKETNKEKKHQMKVELFVTVFMDLKQVIKFIFTFQNSTFAACFRFFWRDITMNLISVHFPAFALNKRVIC